MFIVTAICECPRISIITRAGTRRTRRGAPVPSVMQTNAAQSRVLRDALERPAEVSRLDRSAGPGREHVVAVMPGLPRVVALRGLTETLPAQRRHAHEWYGDDTRAAVLRGVCVQLLLYPLDLVPHGERAVLRSMSDQRSPRTSSRRSPKATASTNATYSGSFRAASRKVVVSSRSHGFSSRD